MKKHYLALFICFIAVLSFLPGCGKDNDPAPPAPKTKTQLISQSTWRFSSATVGGLDASAFLQACQKDNTLAFVAAGTGTLDEGASKCNPTTDPQTSPFTWSFQSSESMLIVSATLFTGGSSTFTLVSLNETQLVLSQVITLGGIPQTAIVTFIH
jgi:Lipocalin-like domain